MELDPYITYYMVLGVIFTITYKLTHKKRRWGENQR